MSESLQWSAAGWDDPAPNSQDAEIAKLRTDLAALIPIVRAALGEQPIYALLALTDEQLDTALHVVTAYDKEKV